MIHRLPSLTRLRGRDDGIALLLTLGVLSLLTLLAFSFAATALNSRISSSLSENLVRARIESETGMQIAYRTLALEFGDPLDPRNIYPATKPGTPFRFGPTVALSPAWDGRTYFTSQSSDQAGLAKALNVLLGSVDFTPDDSQPLPDPAMGWVGLPDLGGSGALASRICWLAVDCSGMIDPTSLLDTDPLGVPEGSETALRVGLRPSEMNLRNLLTDDLLAENFQVVGQGLGMMPVGLRWFSWFHIFRRLPQAIATPLNIQEVLQRVITHSYDLEAFYVNGLDYHRFDLANAPWDSYGNSLPASPLPGIASTFWAGVNTEGPSTGGISWLAQCLDLTIRDQVMANLIDYSDSDSLATTDDASNPTFVGLEKVPYLNEFHVTLQLLLSGTGDYEISAIMTPELVNIHEAELGDQGRLTVTMEINAAEIGTRTLSFSWTALDPVPAKSYQVLAPVSASENIGVYGVLTTTTVTITGASYTNDAGGLWDFARTPASPSVTYNASQIRMLNCEVNDPRHNLGSDQWTWDAAGWSSLSLGTLGSRNTVCDPTPGTGVDADHEPAALDPWEVSTAFIRNAPMQTFWELGAIHRAMAWQTINLHTYNAAANPATGMGAYALGDANMLEQVKLLADTQTTGRVNPNTWNPAIHRTLLTGLTLGGTYLTPTAGPSPYVLTESDAATLAGDPALGLQIGQVLYANGSDGVSSLPFQNRGAIAQASRLWDGTVLAQTTDAAREELIGKTVGLLTVRSNYFAVVMTAQVLRDLPSGIKGGTQGVYDDGIDRIRAQQRLLAIFYRDAFTNIYRVDRLEFLED